MQIDKSKILRHLNLDPGTLRFSGGPDVSQLARELYSAYRDELVALTAAMTPQRKALIAGGYFADFSDRESEMLYLLVRALRPETVVEISPCHGYSTNYILAAMNKNGCGVLHSYEIMTEVRGKPIERVIRDNLSPTIDGQRLNLHVGDASKTEIPESDFTFIDSNHEAWFAGWYSEHVIPKAQVCLVHDIIVYDAGGALIPKAAFGGIKESHYLLQTLHNNGQKCAAICMIEADNERRPLTPRYDTRDRSVLFVGHSQTGRAKVLHRAEQRIFELAQIAIVGDRWTVIREATEMMKSEQSFIRFCAGMLFPILGYRIDSLSYEFPVVYEGVRAAIQAPLTIAEYNAALDLSGHLCAPDFILAAKSAASRSGLDGMAINALFSGYRGQSYRTPYFVARVVNKVSRSVRRVLRK